MRNVKCYVPCFKEKNNNYPDNEGTMVLVKLEKKKFIFSAAHCIHNNELFYLNEKINLVESIPFIKTLISDYKNNENEDIFIGEVEENFEILNREFMNIDLNSKPINDSYICFMGFPVTKNGIKYKKNEFKNRLYSYYEKLIYDSKNDNKHLKIKYCLDKSKNNLGGSFNIAPKPKGISGGPIFEISKSLHEFVKQNIDIKLIGIGTDCKSIDGSRMNKMFIGHSIDYFIALLKEFEFIETIQTYYFKIDKSIFNLKYYQE